MKVYRRQSNWIVVTAALAFAASWATHGRADAPTGRYMVSNGTVYDTKTKLTWQQSPSATLYSWNGAKSACTTLALNGTGWRAPSMKELQTLVDRTRKSPAIDPTFGGGDVAFWTSSAVAYNAALAWTIEFYDGYTNDVPQTNTYRVRCVRD